MPSPFVPKLTIRVSAMGVYTETVQSHWWDGTDLPDADVTRDDLWRLISDLYTNDPAIIGEMSDFADLITSVTRLDTGETRATGELNIPEQDAEVEGLPIRIVMEAWYTAEHIPEWYGYDEDASIETADDLFDAATKLYVTDHPELADELCYDGSLRFKVTRIDTGESFAVMLTEGRDGEHPTDEYQVDLP